MTETSAKSADCVQFTTHSALHADTHNQSWTECFIYQLVFSQIVALIQYSSLHKYSMQHLTNSGSLKKQNPQSFTGFWD